jgi:outer membrane protein
VNPLCGQPGGKTNPIEALDMNKPAALRVFIFTACFACAGILPASESGELDFRPETRPLTLQEAVQMTLARSPDVLLAEARSLRAGEAVRESRSLNRPQVVTGTGLAYNNGYPLSMEGAAPSIFQISASQAIFSKKNNNLIREAEEAGKATRFGSESARNELASQAALVYCELYRARKLISIASTTLDAARKHQELVETLLDAGKLRPVDLAAAKTGTFSAQQQLLVAREQAKVAEIELRDLTGLAETVAIDLAEPHIESPVFELPAATLYQQALDRAPEILQAESDIRAKEFHLKAEKGESLPQMDIITQYALFSRANNYDDFFNRFTKNNFLIGLSLQVPVFNGSRISARVAQSQQEVSEARYRLQRMQSELKMSIERSLSAMRIARGASELARSNLEAARDLVRISEDLMQEGRISVKELEDSRSQMEQKEQAVLEADHSLLQRKLELLRAVGAASSAIQ